MPSNLPTTPDIASIIDDKQAAYIALADRIWAMPELRFEEHQSAGEHLAMLEHEGFRISREVAGMKTAFVGEFGSGGPILAFLGEYDALAGLSQEAGALEARPVVKGGNGHGCGHNLLGTASLLAAAALKRALEEAGLPGTIRYYGCPAEEGGSGKTYMARDGLFDDVDAAFCWHPGVFNMVNSASSLANIQAYFRFRGRAAHAAAAPELGRSALDAVELMNIGVNYMREHMSREARVHYAITKTGGVSPNVVQAEAEVIQLVRAPTIEETRTLFERVRKIAEGAALMTETSVAIEIDRATSNVLPSTTLGKVMDGVMRELGPPAFDTADIAFAEKLTKAALTADDINASVKAFGVQPDKGEVLHRGIAPFGADAGRLSGSTDVGDVSWVTPTVQCWTATCAIGTPFHTWQMVTQGKQPAAHKAMLLAAKSMAGTAAALLRDPETIRKAKDELHERRGRKPYECPMPKSIVPPKGSVRGA
jgi:aminobenzoyl-glutamate utilization protein B